MSKMQVLAAITANIVSIGSAMVFSWPSPAIPIMISEDYPIKITLEEASYFSIIPPIVMIFSAAVFGKVMNIIGRKKAILLIGVPQLISWLMIAFGNSLFVLYLSRAIAGIGDGGVLTVVSTYVAEIVEPKKRGTLGSLVGSCLCYGNLFMCVFGSYTSIKTCALICASFPLVFLIVFAFMPESPYYYLMKNRIDDARKALKLLRKESDVEQELAQLAKDVERQVSEPGNIRDLFYVRSNFKALLIVLGLRLAHQLSGIAGILLYTQYIFEKSGSNVSKETASILVTGLQALIVVFTPLIVDRFGRRFLMIISCTGSGISLLFETIYFYFNQYTDYSSLESFNWVPITGMLLFIFFFSVGLAIVPTLMLGELFPVTVKGSAMSIHLIYFAVLLIYSSKMFQVMENNFGLFPPFAIFCSCCFLFAIFSYFCVPETKGKTLEEIQLMLKGIKVQNKDNKEESCKKN